MLLSDEEAADLKVWIIKKLEDISDADSDVLADYALALIRADAPETELHAGTTRELEDFLKGNTIAFVDDLFEVLRNKSYLPGYVPSAAPVTSATQPIPTIPSGVLDARAGQLGGGAQRSRKRSFNDAHDGHNGHDTHYRRDERQMKQTRRGGMHNGGRGGFGNMVSDFNTIPQVPQFPGLVAPPGGLPFDPNDPMAAILAMQAMGIPMPGNGISPAPAISKNGYNGSKNRINARCRDYDTKGICNRGASCPFNHGDNQIIIPQSQSEEYDPKSPSMVQSATRASPVGASYGDPHNSRGRGRGRGDRGGHQNSRRNNRADFSQAGPNYDKSRSTIVVEQIPEENFSEEAVKGFFSSFGNVEDITLKPYKRLALVKFDGYDAAQAAYESPKVIFDNRFVKVYWYNPNHDQGTNASSKNGVPGSPATTTEPAFDREKFERDTAEAQKRLENRKAAQKETDDQLAKLQKQKEELAKKQAEAQQILREKLQAKGQSVEETVEGGMSNDSNGTEAKPNSKTEALRAQLKALEDEAVSLGLDPEPWNNPGSPGRGRGRGRGSYRGWEGFRGARGGYRGRGSFRGAQRGGGAYNLDRRPKTVKVEGVTFDDGKDESLKQFLSSVGEFTSVEASEPKTSETITFKDRKTAEMFFYGPRTIPGVGKLEFSWVANTQTAVSAPPETPTVEDTTMEDAGLDGANGKPLVSEEYQGRRDDDYDVAGDEDWIS